MTLLLFIERCALLVFLMMFVVVVNLICIDRRNVRTIRRLSVVDDWELEGRLFRGV